MPKPDAKTIRTMLDDVQATVNARYRESPDPTCGCFYQPLPPGSRHGIPFREIHENDQSDLLHTYVRWGDYKEAGVTDAQVVRIWQNVTDGKPRAGWLDDTGLSQPKITLDDLRKEIEADTHAARSDDELLARYRQRKEQGPVEYPDTQKGRDHGMER